MNKEFIWVDKDGNEFCNRVSWISPCGTRRIIEFHCDQFSGDAQFTRAVFEVLKSRIDSLGNKIDFWEGVSFSDNAAIAFFLDTLGFERQEIYRVPTPFQSQ